jgi:hypothetical protein
MTVFTDPACYPAISLHQPYAGAIRLSGLGYPAKRIETRKTRINYRGPVVICATAKRPPGWGLLAGDIANKLGASLAERKMMASEFINSACAVAIANVVGCRPLVEADFQRSLWWDADEVARNPRWAWELEDITPLRPFPTKGAQGFFKLPRQQVDYAAMHGIGDLFQQGGASRVNALILGAFSWPLHDQLHGSRA